MNPASGLLLLGFGDVARAVLRGAVYPRVVASTRRAERAEELAAAGVEALVAPGLDAEAVAPWAEGADVLVSFPPDGVTDARIAPGLMRARRVVYLSSTAVYGDRRGVIDDGTLVDPQAARGAPRLAAEEVYRALGAVVLRAPGLYGPGVGLHERLRAGNYRVPGDGQGCISRLHLADLGALVRAAWARGRPGECYVVGDLSPVPQIEVIRFLCERMGMAIPPSLPLSEVSPTLRGDRRVDPSRALRELGVTLRYPGYREGFVACLGPGLRGEAE